MERWGGVWWRLGWSVKVVWFKFLSLVDFGEHCGSASVAVVGFICIFTFHCI